MMVKQTQIALNPAILEADHTLAEPDAADYQETIYISQEYERPSLADIIKTRLEAKDFFFSVEMFPPRTITGKSLLLQRLQHMKAGGALFCSMTWHPAGNPGSDAPTSSMSVAGSIIRETGLETMLHIAGTQQTKIQFENHLKRAKSLGVRNIMAIRGDNPSGSKAVEDGLSYGRDLVLCVREQFGSSFTVAVAGYPSGHPAAVSYQQDLHYLKMKVDAGADLIITQMFFNAKIFINFVQDCRRIGITVPIIPGILFFQSYTSVQQMVNLSHLTIPPDMMQVISTIKDNDEAVQSYGIYKALEICNAIFEASAAPGIHIFTLNRESGPMELCKRLGLWLTSPASPLPWRCIIGCSSTQLLLPVEWATQPQYHKDEPNFFKKVTVMPFTLHLAPFCSPQFGNQKETRKFLLAQGILTVNFQPNISHIPSDHPVFGWGDPDGHVYQKAYIEFFANQKVVESLKSHLIDFPTISAYISDKSVITNNHSSLPTAITWGMFPGQELIQTTVISEQRLQTRKNEAFTKWCHWADNCNSPLRELFTKIYDSFFFVSLIDHSYEGPTVLWNFLASSI